MSAAAASRRAPGPLPPKRPTLLARTSRRETNEREQAARLAAVAVLANYLETLADGENHYASLICGALGAPRS